MESKKTAFLFLSASVYHSGHIRIIDRAAGLGELSGKRKAAEMEGIPADGGNGGEGIGTAEDGKEPEGTGTEDRAGG